ncbi:unnamed protein product, partial [Medioppia subpectinata]
MALVCAQIALTVCSFPLFPNSLLGWNKKTSKELVIIDTDSGVDDALAIMLATYCHKHNMIDIMAITCQFGNTYVEDVVRNVGLTLRASDTKGIKIYSGADEPLVGNFVLDDYYGRDGLGNATQYMPPIDVRVEREHAVNALVRLAREHPKQITLIALGPLTNIALAYMLDNNFFDNLKQIVFMGGTLDFDGNSDPVKSFNINSDVEAISKMLSKASCPVTIIPNECCKSHVLTWDIYDQILKLNSNKSKFLKQITDLEVNRNKEKPGSKGITMFDMLAVMAPIYEDYIESKVEYKTSVELKGELTRGELVFDKRSQSVMKMLLYTALVCAQIALSICCFPIFPNSLLSWNRKTSKELVIIDTDSGVDDAMAIMLATYCQKHNMIDIMAITCQFGNTYVEDVVRNVGLTLRATDSSGIKIYRGAETPFVGNFVLDDYYGRDGLGNATQYLAPIDVRVEREHAANALVRLAREHPKQITMIALGPLTNIALAYMLDNNFFDNLKQIVFLGGSLGVGGNFYPGKDFNIDQDVEAVSRVLSTASCPITIVPIDTCDKHVLTWDMYNEILKLNTKKSNFMKQITDMEVNRQKDRSKGMTMYDMLVVMAPIFEDYIESKVEYKTNIELNGRFTRGDLVFDKLSTPNDPKTNWKSVNF